MRIDLSIQCTGPIEYQAAGAATAEAVYLMEHGHKINVTYDYYPGDPDRARNISASRFLLGDADALVFVASDAVIPRGSVAKLARAAVDADSIVGAFIAEVDGAQPEPGQVGASFTAYSRGALQRAADGCPWLEEGFRPIFAPSTTTGDSRRYLPSAFAVCEAAGTATLMPDIRPQRMLTRAYVADPIDEPASVDFAGELPRVVLCYDRDGWAFHNIAKQVALRLADKYQFALVPQKQLPMGVKCDVLVNFWWGESAKLARQSRAAKTVTCVYDSFSWQMDNYGAKRLEDVLASTDALAVANRPFADALRAQYGEIPPVHICEDSVDAAMFVPLPLPSEFTLGWAGNSKTSEQFQIYDLKGLDLIKQAARLTNTPLEVLDAADGAAIEHSEMPAWYGKISCYVCASLTEGGPNPMLEAMACGRPAISTRVGLAPKMIEAGGGVLVDRSVASIAKAIETMKTADLAAMGKQARSAAELQTWNHTVKSWDRLLTSLVS